MHGFKRPLISTAIICLLFISRNAVYGQSAQTDWKSQALKSIAILEVQKQGTEKCSGMVFLAIKDGAGITTHNVLSGAAAVIARFPNGEEYESTGLIDRDEKRNAALIRLRLFGKPLLTVRAAEPAPGEKISCAVNKVGAFGFIEAEVGEKEIVDGTARFKIAAAIPDGSDGAPVFDGQGSIVGLLAGELKESTVYHYLIPSPAILALDDSLPTQPWLSPAAGDKPAQPQSEPDSPETIDLALAEAFIALDDLDTIRVYTVVTSADYGFRKGVPTNLYNLREQAEEALKALTRLRLKEDDELRANVAKAILAAGNKLLESVDLLTKAIVLSQEAVTWTAQSDDLWKQHLGLVSVYANMNKQQQGVFSELYQTSEVFKKALSPETAYDFGILSCPSKFRIGILSYPRDPFYVLLLEREEFGYKLGFRQSDKIISVGGKTFETTDTIEDLKLIIQNNLGKQIEAVVERGENQKTIRLKIPAEIPDKYLYED